MAAPMAGSRGRPLVDTSEILYGEYRNRSSRRSPMPQADQVPVPARARELARLARVDYADCFAVEVAATYPPEQWIRTATETMPNLFSAVRVAHRGLGL